jgi:predicted nucleic acid-binding Zn ribbon protein
MARKIDKLSKTIDKILKARGMQNRLPEYRLSSKWVNMVGPAIARHAQPRTLRGGKLQVIVDSPAWMQQLSLMKAEIIGKLNNNLGMDIIRDITLKLGEIAPLSMQSSDAEQNPAIITQEEQEMIAQSIDDVGDNEIREAIKRVIEKHLLRMRRESGQ